MEREGGGGRGGVGNEQAKGGGVGRGGVVWRRGERARARGRENRRPPGHAAGLAAPQRGRSEGERREDWRGDKVGTWESVGPTRQPL